MERSSFFFNNIDIDYIDKSIIDNFETYSINNLKHIYFINKPLSEKKYDYTINKVLIFLCPGYNIQFVNLNLDEEEFKDIYADFIEDLGHIADKYDYTKIIRRPRIWKKFIKQLSLEEFLQDASDIENFMNKNEVCSESDKRTVKLLITLLTGSINSVEKIGEELPQSILEKVKKNIILFDGDQTRFIFEDNYSDKIVKIQGLAGTGKTELLLHRLKEIYVSNKNVKIVFTCQSKTLANRLKNRITDFFNFMRVEEQIEWDERLWVMHAWGSVKDSYNLGTYGMICRKYNLPFYTARDGSFAYACSQTLDYIKQFNIEIEPFVDYMLIDEGQDFTESFIELCSLVTKKQVFVAGDIFQDIFGIQNIETRPNYLLNKCYRTDPRTLMFSHALGLGLYEDHAIRFLKDSEWDACGYSFENKVDKYILKREPVNRFDDIESLDMLNGINLISYNEYKTSIIIDTIKNIKKDFPDVKPDDIAVVFPNEKLNYVKIDSLTAELYHELKWNTNLLYNTKEIFPGTLTISNKNNIKGLEFPFIICVADYRITRDLAIRNTLYMTLTRSFISSYLLIQESRNSELIHCLRQSLEDINKNLEMTVKKPSKEELEHQESIIRQYNKPSLNQYEILTNIFDELKISNSERRDYRGVISRFKPNETDREKLKNIILNLSGDYDDKGN